MAVHAQVAASRREAVQKNIIGPQELGATDDLDAKAEDGAAVDGIRVRIASAKGGKAGANAIETLLVVCLLGRRVGKKA